MTKRKQIVALLVGVLLLAGAAGTFAWLSVTGVLVNEFGFGLVKPSVDETRDNNVKSDVAVKNSGSAPAYLRVAVDIYWQDKDGARLWDEPVAGKNYVIEWGKVANASATNSASSWVRSADGFYYWTSSVAPMGKTDVLIKKVKKVTQENVDGKNLVVDISTQAIQSTPDDAAKEAWGCKVNDGVLVPPYGGA